MSLTPPRTTAAEISAAKQAVLAFARAAFGVNRVRLWNEELGESLGLLLEVARMEPAADSRLSPGGDPLDFVSPSFWHASACLLANWAGTRVLREDFDSEAAVASFGNHWVFRGQPHPWPLQPSAWRSPDFRKAGHQMLDVFRDYLESHLPNVKVPGLSEFTPLDDLACATAVAQHYGFPTNYLDFTFHPLVALYFANAQCPAPPPDGHRPGHAVVYSIGFGQLMAISESHDAQMHLHLPPPWAMKRWYQQIGIHVDCGPHADSGARSPQQLGWQDVEQRCYALHFPRTYPDPDEGEELVAPFALSQFLSHGAEESYAPATLALQYLWYDKEPFFEQALTALRRYCDQAGGRFDRARARAALEAAGPAEPPWAMDTHGFPQQELLRVAADPMRVAANYLIDAAGICSASGLHFDPVVLIEFLKRNDDYARWLPHIAREVDLYDLLFISGLVAESVDRWNGLVGARPAPPID